MDASGEQTERARRWPKRLLRAAAALVALVLLHALVGFIGARVEDRTAPRTPDGIRVGAEERTLGPENAPGAVLFVHGFVGGSNNFAEVPDALAAQGWRVRVMRLPGHGTSPRDPAQQDASALIEAVRREAAALREKHRKLVLVGHSMGGALCTLAAAESPPDALVLAAPYFGVTYHWYYALPPETWVGMLSPLAPYVYKGQLFLQVNRREAKPSIFSYQWIPSRNFRTLVNIGRRAKDPAVLARINCRVLLLHAQGDVAASYEASAAALAQMPSKHKQRVELPRSNHHIFWDYDQDLVQESIVAFLKALS